MRGPIEHRQTLGGFPVHVLREDILLQRNILKRSGSQPGGTGEYGGIAGVESRAEEKDRRDAADDSGEVAGFVLVQGAA